MMTFSASSNSASNQPQSAKQAQQLSTTAEYLPEPDYQTLREHFQTKMGSSERQYFTLENYSIRIFELLVVTALIAVSITLIRNFELVGALILFSLFLCFSTVASWWIENASQVRFWNQLLWGMLMPVACVFADPFVFGTFEAGLPISLHDERCVAPYFILGYSILMLVFSWMLQPKSFPWLNAMIAGQLMTGALIMFCIGLLLIPVSLVGLLALVGVVGFTPWITGMIYLKTSLMHLDWAKQQSRNAGTVFALGLLIPFFVFGFLLSLAQAGFFSDALRLN